MRRVIETEFKQKPKKTDVINTEDYNNNEDRKDDNTMKPYVNDNRNKSHGNNDDGIKVIGDVIDAEEVKNVS